MIILALFLLLSSVSFTGCGNESIVVLYTIYPVGYVLERIGGSFIETECLSAGNSTIQIDQINPNYTDLLERANLILLIGDIESYREIYEDDIKNSTAEIIDLSGLASIYEFKRYITEEVNGNSITLESDFYEGDVFDTIDSYDKDYNIWLDPIAMTSLSRTILDWLVENDPINSAYYISNFEELEKRSGQTGCGNIPF